MNVNKKRLKIKNETGCHALSPKDIVKVNDIIAYKTGVEKDEVVPSAHFFNDLGIDSLEYAELIMELELKFLISIPDNESKKARKVSEIYKLIAKKLAEKQ